MLFWRLDKTFGLVSLNIHEKCLNASRRTMDYYLICLHYSFIGEDMVISDRWIDGVFNEPLWRSLKYGGCV